MEILINDKRTIREVQQDFTGAYPFLKVEFFSSKHNPGQPSPRSQMFASDKKLSECRKQHNTGKIAITDAETVTDLETQFWQLFGLNAQVFRRSGNIWIETSLTDSWTLTRQNEEGREISTSSHRENKKWWSDFDESGS